MTKNVQERFDPSGFKRGLFQRQIWVHLGDDLSRWGLCVLLKKLRNDHEILFGFMYLDGCTSRAVAGGGRTLAPRFSVGEQMWKILQAPAGGEGSYDHPRQRRRKVG